MTSDTLKQNIIYITNGSNKIFICDASKNFKILSIRAVRYKGESVNMLNEIQDIGRYLLANVYMTDNIVLIKKKTFKIKKIFDL